MKERILRGLLWNFLYTWLDFPRLSLTKIILPIVTAKTSKSCIWRRKQRLGTSNKLTIKQLKERLKDKGLKARGSKAEMIARLLEEAHSKKLPPPKAPVRLGFFFFFSFISITIRPLQDMEVFVLEIASQIRLAAAIDVYVCFSHTL
jgi:hypothetical protein